MPVNVMKLGESLNFPLDIADGGGKMVIRMVIPVAQDDRGERRVGCFDYPPRIPRARSPHICARRYYPFIRMNG